LAFFYHSNCAIPGIAGIMQVMQEHSIDESAFDPNHPYYDPKSTDRSKPKWELVHVKFSHKFDNLITLKELKAHMGPGKPLEHLQTLKQSRLSVTSVSPKEWNFIIVSPPTLMQDVLPSRQLLTYFTIQDLSGEEFEDDQQSRRVDNGMPVDDEADETLTANANADAEFDAEDGAGALDLDTNV
jgi:predicted RNA-binding protein with PUA-like domain